ncbi:MAG: hypothetical protein ABF968_07285 [Acetobacter sp.]|uniref:hypothetical protein n=1 Tax=Acetobacter sp. TaxID=440 RepID=UPI0039EB68A2
MHGWEEAAVWVAIGTVLFLVVLLELVERARHEGLRRDQDDTRMRVETLERDVKASLQRIETSLAVVGEGGRKTEQMVAVIVRGHMERKS